MPLQLPARLWIPSGRPLAAPDLELLANCVSVAFDASRSSDPDGDQLSYEWLFGDGTAASGRALVHEYPGPGTYNAALRVLDASGQVGAGAVLPLEISVKRPPLAVAGADGVVRRTSRSPSTAPVRRPASGRSPAMCGASTTAAAPRA